MDEYLCDGCGACCRTFPIFASHQDAAREPRIARESLALPDHLQAPDWAYKLFRIPFHDACCFLDANNRCVIYGTRPSVCREFCAGDDQCQEARQRQGLAPLLPAPVPRKPQS